MIPSADELAAGWSFVARRRGLTDAPDLAMLDRIVEVATECAGGNESAEPAALFFALARHPRAFDRGWRVSCEVFPAARATALGQRLRTNAFELADLRLAVYAGRTDCEGVKAWFAERLTPR